MISNLSSNQMALRFRLLYVKFFKKWWIIFSSSETSNRSSLDQNISRNLLNSHLLIFSASEPVKRTSQIYRELPAEEPRTGPDFTKKLESAVVMAGTRHYMECLVTGSQPMDIKWFVNDKQVHSSPRTTVSFNERTGVCLLVINEVDPGDSALFACRVANELGMAETSAYLKVKEVARPVGSAPMVVTPLESVQLNAEANYTLECIITGEPEPQVTWFKDSIEINTIPEPMRSTFKQSRFMNVRQLSIVNASPDWHSGAYTCRARNEYGEADCSCGILIRSKSLCYNDAFMKLNKYMTNLK